MQQYSIALLCAAVASAYDYGHGYDRKYEHDYDHSRGHGYAAESYTHGEGHQEGHNEGQQHYTSQWQHEEPEHYVQADHHFVGVQHEGAHLSHPAESHHQDDRDYYQSEHRPLAAHPYGHEAEYAHQSIHEPHYNANSSYEAETSHQMADHNVDHYNMRTYEQGNEHGFGNEHGVVDHRYAEHAYYGDNFVPERRDEGYHARPQYEYAHHMPEYQHRFDGQHSNQMPHQGEESENFTPPAIYHPFKKRDKAIVKHEPAKEPATPATEPAAPAKEPAAPAKEPAAPEASSSSPSTPPADPSKPSAPKAPSSSPSTPPKDPSKPAEKPAEKPTSPADPSKPAEKPAAPADPSAAPVDPSADPADPSTDPTLQEKAKALAKEMKEFVKTELDNGDLERFVQYCGKFGKSYINKIEFKARLWQWKQTDKFISEASWDKRKHYKVAHNKFSDWSKHEYQNMLGYAAPAEKQAKNIVRMPEVNKAITADSIDWRDADLVSDVVDQGICGSDWAFAAMGALEGAFGVQTGEFVPLSVQQALDCTGSATGCKGGTMSQAFDYLKTEKAMVAADYPYNFAYPQRADACGYDKTKSSECQVDSYTFADKGDVTMMKLALSHQPIAASMNAESDSFKLYQSGVFDDESCDASVLNHAILLIGYGSESGEDYWLAKNSWGNNWGEKGYFRVAISPEAGICGIHSTAVWPVLK